MENYLKYDFRIVSLVMVIKGMEETITALKNKINEIYWYDGNWFLDESEPVYGLALIAFQNYINGSILDFSNNLNEKKTYYTYGQNLNHKNNKIELIIGLANYYKHKDEGSLYKGTRDILENFNLEYKDVVNLEKSPIFQGLTLLDENWDLNIIKDSVVNWRESLWSNNDLRVNDEI